MTDGAVSYINIAISHYQNVIIIIMTILIIFLISKK